MSSRISQGYTNFLDFRKRRSQRQSTQVKPTSSVKGFMSPQGQPKPQQSSSQFAQLERVAEIVDEIKKSREV